MSFCTEIEKMRGAHRGLARKLAAGEPLTKDELVREQQLAPDPAFIGLVAHFRKELGDA